MQDKKDDKTTPNGAIDLAGEAAASVKKGVSLSSAAAKGMGASIPSAAGYIGKAAGVIAATITEKGDGWVEKAACGTARVLAQGYASAPLIGPAIALAAAKAPPNPYLKAGAGALGALAAGPIVNEATKPIGEAAAQVCHQTFDLHRNRNSNTETPPKQVQKDAAQQQLTDNAVRNQAINGFRPNIPTTIPLAKYNAYNTPYRPFYQPPATYFLPFNVRSEVNAILARYGSSISFTDKMMIERRIEMACTFLECQMRSGYSHMYGAGDFRSTLAMTGLINSYNSYNVQSMVYEAIRSYGNIGGVAGDVSLINDLIDSDAHAKASSYFFCFPTHSFPFPLSLITQIAQELKTAYFTHKTLPFFSLHFNNQGYMYPVNHAAYGDTLTGLITAILDYWMKGFLNGGIFDAEFLKKWHELSNCDEQYLRAQLIDLKKYCKANSIHYISLRELESRYGLKSKPNAASSAYKQPFMTSFRIIASQEQIKRHGNILIPTPTFRVEYSIDLMPDYKEFLEKYHKEHGEYPEDYERIRQCYELFAQEIKEKLPQMPFCRDYFQLLGVINSLCYAYTTFEKMGKEPIISDLTKPQPYFIPKAFPPIPVRYFRTYPIKTSFGEILSAFINTPQDTQLFDQAVFALFSNKQERTFSEPFKSRLQQVITHLIQNELSKTLQSQSIEINDEEIERITKKSLQFILGQVHQTHRAINHVLQQWLEPADQTIKRELTPLPLPQKLVAMQQHIDKRFAELKSRWEAAATVSLDQVLREFPKSLHANIKTSFSEVDAELRKELNELIYLCKKSAGSLLPHEQVNEQQIEIPLQQRQNIEANFKAIEDSINKDFATELQNAQQELTQLQTIKTQLQANLAQANQALITQQQHKINQINSVPAHLRQLNAAQINSFTASMDQKIGQIQQAITEIQGKITIVDQGITQLTADIAAAPGKKGKTLAEVKDKFANQMIDDFKANFTKAKEQAYQQQAIHVLTQTHQNNQRDLARFTQHIQHFSQVLNNITPLKEHILSNEYTHTMMAFTGQGLDQQIGDTYKIVGGCGMSLPNLQSKPMDNADEFSLSLANALNEKQGNQAIQFSFNGQEYMVYEVAVKDAPLTLENPKSPIVTELLNPEADINNLVSNINTDSLDPSGANLLHYAATILDGKEFAKTDQRYWTTVDNLGNTLLHYAAQSGNNTVVEEILAHVPDLIDRKNARGLTPLFLAVQHERLETMKLLMSRGANPNHTLANGLFPLFVTIQNNFHELAVWLIDNVPSLAINQEIDSKMTALHLSIDAKDAIVAQKLIEKGATCSIKRKSDGFTAVHCAAKQGLTPLLKLMHDKGIPLHLPLESGKTALHLAAEANQLEAVEFLITHDAKADMQTVDGDTPLMLAIKAGHVEVANRLACIATINATNNQQQTASQLAIQYGMPIIGDILIGRGEDPALLDKKEHNYVYYLIRNGEESRFSSLSIDTAQEFQGENLLELAAKFGQFLIVYDLLALGLEYRNKANRPTLLEYAIINDEIGFVKDHILASNKLDMACLAAQHGSVRCLTWLLTKLQTDELQNPNLLKASLESHQSKPLELVLKRFTNINKELDNKGNTALHLAAKYGAKSVINQLIQSGAKSTLRNHANQTAFHIAIAQEDNALLKQLFKLTDPKEWPLDIWTNIPPAPSHPIHNTLVRFKKQLPSQTIPVLAKQDKTNRSLPSLLMTAELSEGLTALKQLFNEDEFDEALALLEEKPELIQLFESEQGGDLLLTLFANISDYSHLVSALNSKEPDEEEVTTSFLPHKLLSHLKKSGINPAQLIGKNNVLLAMLGAKNDEEACYRLKLFNDYFPESLAPLALDKGGKLHKIVEMALKINKKQLFTALDELCSKQEDSEIKSLNTLHEAVRANNYELVARLIKRHSVNSLNSKRQTPLMIAAAKNNVRIMELLLDNGANAECIDIFGQNALHHALHKGHEEAALTLLPMLRHKNLANRKGHTPLMLAASKGLYSIVQFLCEQNDYTQSVDNKGLNALHHAALNGQAKTIEQLVSHGFAINAIENPATPKKMERNLKRTALHIAALHGHVDAVSTLLSLGADLTLEDSAQNTVFEYAVISKKNQLLQLLQQLDAYHQKARDIPLLLAAAKANNVEMLSQLILCEVNLNGTDTSGLTALHLAAINNSIQFVRLLLSGKDIAIDLTDKEGMTPLHYAATLGHVGLIDALLNAGAKINYKNNSQPTALFMACAQGHLGAVTSLLAHKADFTITSTEGLTPAQHALINGHILIAKKLQGLGDTSLSLESISTLPKGTQDKLREIYPLLQQTVSKAPVRIGELLVSHGIYRQKTVHETTAVSNLSPTV